MIHLLADIIVNVIYEKTNIDVYWLKQMMYYLLLFAGIISFYLSIKIFNKDRLFGITFVILQIYIYIPFAARIYDSNLVDIVSHIQINDESTLINYILFCYVFNLILFFLSKILRFKREVNKYAFIPNDKLKKNLVFYNIIQFLVGFYLWYYLLINYSQLSYYNQQIVKTNTIWCIALEYSFVFSFINYLVYKDKGNTAKQKFFSIGLGLMLILPSIITQLKIGSRGIAMPAIIGILYTIVEKKDIKISLFQLKKLFIPLLIILLIIASSQFVRNNRGDKVDNFSFSLIDVWSFFDVSVFLFQDYTVPGNSLMYCMENRIIDPLFVCKSNIGNGLFFLDAPTIAEQISDFIADGENFGVGGFIPVEGYYFAGWLGCLLLPFVIICFYRFYYSFLFVKCDTQFNTFMGFLLCTFVSMNLARGQTYFLFKVLYMYIIPCVVLYIIAIGRLKFNNAYVESQ